MIKISMWSDFSCPYCYIAEKRLENLISEMEIQDKVQFDFHSFELYPDAPITSRETTLERFAKKYNLSTNEAQVRIEAISNLGRKEGLDFRYASTKNTNTMDAHRLSQYVKSLGNPKLTQKVINLIFESYFTSNLELANHDVLLDIAKKVNLDLEEVKSVLLSNKFKDTVRQDEFIAASNKILAVPFFVINGNEIMGAQDKTVFKKLLLNELNKNIKFEKTSSCDINGCEI